MGAHTDGTCNARCDGVHMSKIVILGAGTGGTLTANRLRRVYGDNAEIVVVDRDDREGRDRHLQGLA